jgi:hypothetical protein
MSSYVQNKTKHLCQEGNVPTQIIRPGSGGETNNNV